MTDDEGMVKAIPGGSCLRKPPVIGGGAHHNNIGETKRSPENGAGLRQFKKKKGNLSTSGSPCFYLICEHHGQNKEFPSFPQNRGAKKKINKQNSVIQTHAESSIAWDSDSCRI